MFEISVVIFQLEIEAAIFSSYWFFSVVKNALSSNVELMLLLVGGYKLGRFTSLITQIIKLHNTSSGFCRKGLSCNQQEASVMQTNEFLKEYLSAKFCK